MLTVKALAKQSRTTPDAVRYYTRIGLLQPRRNPHNGYRLYREREINYLFFVHKAKRLGYTLNEIAHILHDAERGNSSCPRVREILERRIKENRAELHKRELFLQRLEAALAQWKSMPDGVPDSQSVCHLIESTPH